jgi:hypothetical protein
MALEKRKLSEVSLKIDLLATWMFVSGLLTAVIKVSVMIQLAMTFTVVHSTVGGCAHFDEKPGCGQQESNAFFH